MAVLTSPETYQADPENAWRRLAGACASRKEIAVLMEIAAWREREAQSRDVPRGRILKDDALIDIAISAPRSVEALGQLALHPQRVRALPHGRRDPGGRGAGLARDPATVPALERCRGRAGPAPWWSC